MSTEVVSAHAARVPGAFGLILDDVDDVPEVDDVGFDPRAVWSVGGIPSLGGDAELRERAHVVASAAPIVEDGRAPSKRPSLKACCNGLESIVRVIAVGVGQPSPHDHDGFDATRLLSCPGGGAASATPPGYCLLVSRTVLIVPEVLEVTVPENLLTTEEAAATLRVSTKTVLRRIRSGQLPQQGRSVLEDPSQRLAVPDRRR